MTVQSTCIVMPFVTGKILREFGVGKLSRGELYGSGNGKFCTVLHTRMGSIFTGDAVLYLSNTPCRELYLLGTCGLFRQTQGLKIGSLVSPSLCYAQESFTALLSGRMIPEISSVPDPEIFRNLMGAGGGELIEEVIGVSAGSLKMQVELLPEWRKKKIEVVDLESAAFLAAARQVKISAAALMVVSDFVEERPWYQQDNRELISESLTAAARILCEIVRRKQSD